MIAPANVIQSTARGACSGGRSRRTMPSPTPTIATAPTSAPARRELAGEKRGHRRRRGRGAAGAGCRAAFSAQTSPLHPLGGEEDGHEDHAGQEDQAEVDGARGGLRFVGVRRVGVLDVEHRRRQRALESSEARVDRGRELGHRVVREEAAAVGRSVQNPAGRLAEQGARRRTPAPPRSRGPPRFIPGRMRWDGFVTSRISAVPPPQHRVLQARRQNDEGAGAAGRP